jgi:two-component system OmpR family sensor kinase
MNRWLGWVGLAVLVAGAMAAFVVRLATPATLLEYRLWGDPAVAVLVVTLIAAALFLSAAALGRWQTSRTQHALDAQALTQETERRRFIHRLDHELKNPLTAIQVQLDNLQAGDDTQPQAIVEVRAQADRLASLTRGLRRLADLETRPLEIERVEVGELLGEVIDLLQAPERIVLDVQRVPWPIPTMHGDRELLLMVFRNLVDNALKYSTTPVQVRARDMAGALVVEVIDTGRGIQPDELPLVTEELYRGRNTRDVPGSGLGLAIVQRIVERHGGRLELRSRLGQGTIATVQLPYARLETADREARR